MVCLYGSRWLAIAPGACVYMGTTRGPTNPGRTPVGPLGRDDMGMAAAMAMALVSVLGPVPVSAEQVWSGPDCVAWPFEDLEKMKNAMVGRKIRGI